MKPQPLKKITPLLCLLFVFTACRKDNHLVTHAVVKDASNSYFNWETASTMPVSPSSPQVSMPWQSQSGSYIDSYLVSDYKSSDGWELVYNTFNSNVIATASSEPAGGLYFTLYNKFRGLLRYYLYIPSGLFGGSSSIEHGLNIYSDNSTTSKMLNFDGVEIVDPTANTAAFTKTNNLGVAVGGGWYAMQYEIAYDSNFPATTYPHLGIIWKSRTVSISQIELNGTSIGTLNGNIKQPSSGFNWSGTLINGILAAVETYGTIALATAAVDKPVVNNLKHHKLGVDDASPTVSQELNTAAQSGLSGNVTGFLSGLFGGNSSNSQEVNLTMNSSLSLNGTLTTSQPLNPNTFVFPGQTTSNTVGAPAPLITHALGIFNLTGRPTVNVHTTSQPVTVTENGQPVIYNQYSIQYTVNQSVFTSLFKSNPYVINSASTGATITNLNTSVVVINPNTDNGFNAIGTNEVISTLNTYTGSPVTLQYTVEHGLSVSTPQVAVRVSFNVNPTNGAPAVLVVKTFLANLVNN